MEQRPALVEDPNKAFANHTKFKKRCAGVLKEPCGQGALRCKNCNLVFAPFLRSKEPVIIIHKGERRSAQIKEVVGKGEKVVVYFEEGEERTAVEMTLELGVFPEEKKYFALALQS